jgi:hypothetical protein
MHEIHVSYVEGMPTVISGYHLPDNPTAGQNLVMVLTEDDRANKVERLLTDLKF